MYFHNHETDLSGSLYQTILPDVDSLFKAMIGELNTVEENGRVGISFDSITEINRQITGLVETDKLSGDKMPSNIEEQIFLPLIISKLAKVATTMLPYGKFHDEMLIPFKIALATSVTRLVDGGIRALPFQEENKMVIGKACATRIDSFFREKGIKEQNINSMETIYQFGHKVREEQITSDELADLALMSAFVNHYTPDAGIIYPTIREKNQLFYPLTHILLGTYLKVYRSSLAEYFPVSTSFEI